MKIYNEIDEKRFHATPLNGKIQWNTRCVEIIISLVICDEM